MNAANDDFDGPLPSHDEQSQAHAVFKRVGAFLSKAGEVLADLVVPIAVAILLAAAGFHQP